MILVDSSVWIDFFRGKASAETDRLDQLLGSEPVLIGDIILTEVLQGFAIVIEENNDRRIVAICHQL